MEDRLKNFKKAMKRTVLQDLTFTEKHKSSIRRQISYPSISEEGVLVAIFHLLKEKRTGFELNRLLRARGIEKFENEEGFLYMSLHRLEHKGYLHTHWIEPDVKYYQLNAKGLKMLNNLENEGNYEAYFLNEILER
ncbi:PadR family transcriptional regulator [Cytobacillus firmus]|uniref:PadR family transcriptional regulator n=1 Tax=Cytobacillus firmus TaxID=1399 RepID=UPI00237AAD27|nr:PadR family transcriptional regulator [Cytobacillus firmus]MDD9309913.1 PadR family transcriptional regulator [Cytobacillus firmus]